MSHHFWNLPAYIELVTTSLFPTEANRPFLMIADERYAAMDLDMDIHYNDGVVRGSSLFRQEKMH